MRIVSSYVTTYSLETVLSSFSGLTQVFGGVTQPVQNDQNENKEYNYDDDKDNGNDDDNENKYEENITKNPKINPLLTMLASSSHKQGSFASKNATESSDSDIDDEELVAQEVTGVEQDSDEENDDQNSEDRERELASLLKMHLQGIQTQPMPIPTQTHNNNKIQDASLQLEQMVMENKRQCSTKQSSVKKSVPVEQKSELPYFSQPQRDLPKMTEDTITPQILGGIQQRYDALYKPKNMEVKINPLVSKKEIPTIKLSKTKPSTNNTTSHPKVTVENVPKVTPTRGDLPKVTPQGGIYQRSQKGIYQEKD